MKNQRVVGEWLNLLKGVSGAFKPSVLTTLMDKLAGRKTRGNTGGTMTISSNSKKQFARICGYCEQKRVDTELQSAAEPRIPNCI